MRTIRVGSRDSRLAVVQTGIFLSELRRRYPEYEFTLTAMKTAGDMILDKPLDQIGGKGLFIKELDKALLENRIDIAVHSLKDMPVQIPDGLCIRVYGAREDPRDALVLPAGCAEPDMRKPIGSTSRRRKIQLQRLYPEWSVADIRGNLLTRLEKLDQGDYGALVLAAAGLKRLGLAHRIYRFFEPEELLPSAGQGTLVIVTRAGEDCGYLEGLDDPESRCRSLAERALVKALGGDCGAPIAVYAAVEKGVLTLTGFFCPEKSGPAITGSVSGAPEEGEDLGRNLALYLLGTYHRETGGRGKVWLVGAGPGDAGLLTLKGDSLLKQADAVCYDHLVGKGVLARIPPSAELLYVGKRAGCHPIPQEEINRLLVQKAALGKRVVRLKGGDPFLFGRGGEELEALNAAGIPFEAVPGVSSALAAPAYAGIPVSHRDYCSEVHIITGHTRDGQHSINYKALAQTGGTFVFLMGLAAVEPICRGLLDAGLNPDTPGAVIEQGTTAKQRTVSAPLSGLAETAKTAGITAPALIVIGGVCALSGRLSWAESRPLAGIRIAVTGLERSESRLSELLSAEGAETLALPTIRIAPIADTPELEAALGALTGREWCAFTSPAGVEVFFSKLRGYRRDVRTLGGVKFAAVGKATASALEEQGILTDLVPGGYGGAELGAELAKAVRPGERVILPRSRIGGDDILRVLAEAGVEVADIALYDTLPLDRYQDPAYRELLLENLDWLTFTSSSGVEGFAAAFGTDAMKTRKALCIGRQTAQAAVRYGMETCVAKSATLESMAETLKEKILGGL